MKLLLRPSKTNGVVFEKLNHISMAYKDAIRTSYIIIGQYLKRTNAKDFRAPKSGRWYRVQVNGKTVLHHASAPGEPPARLTGALERSIQTKVAGYGQMTYSAGNSMVDYARKLEEGSIKVAPRPYMIKAIRENEGIIFVTFRREVGKNLK